MAVVINVYGKADLKQIEKAEKQLAGLKKEAAPTSSAWSRAGSVIGSTGAKIAAGFAAAGVAKFAMDATRAASDLNESQSKAAVVFGKSSGAINAWASTAATALGQSKQQALEAAGTFGNLFTSMGLTQGKAAKLSTSTVQLASDLASFNNSSPQEALDALRSGLVGETEPLRRFGINISAAGVQAEALRMGLLKGVKDTPAINAARLAVANAQQKLTTAVKEHGKTSLEAKTAASALALSEQKLGVTMKGKVPELTAAQKAQAAYSLMMKQSTNAQGDFARTSDGLANGQRILAAKFEDTKAALGKTLMPIMNAVVGKVNQLLTAFTSLPGPLQKIIIGIAAFAGAAAIMAPFVTSIIGAAKAMKLAAVATKIWTAAQWLWNAAMSANPIGLVIVAIIALVAAFVILWKKCAWFRNFWIGLWKGIVGVAKSVWSWMKPGLMKIWTGIKTVWSKVTAAVKAFWNWAGPYIKAGVQVWWAQIKLTLAVILAVFKVVWKAISFVVKGAIANVKTTIHGIQALIAFVRGVFNAIKNVALTIGRQIAQRVGDIWRGIKSTAQTVWDGVTGVVRTAWNNIAGFVNKIIGAFNWVISKVPGLSGKTIPTLPTAKGDDSRSSASVAGAAKTLARRTGDDSRPAGIGDFSDSVGSVLSTLNPMNLLDKVPWPDVPGGMFGGAAAALLKLVKEAVANLVKKALSSIFGSDTGSGSANVGGAGYAWAYALAKRFGLFVTSTFRPGAITASGNVSDHGTYGRAADIAGSLGGMGSLWSYVKATAGSWKQAIYQHQMINYGQLGYYGPSDHFDHVHLARATGGDSRSASERGGIGAQSGDTYVFEGCLFAQDFDTVIAEANQRGSVKLDRRTARTRAVR